MARCGRVMAAAGAGDLPQDLQGPARRLVWVPIQWEWSLKAFQTQVAAPVYF